MKAWFFKLPTGDLRPLDSDSLKSMAAGEAYEFEFRKKRNYKFLQKFMLFLKAVYDIETIQEQFSSVEHLRYALTMDVGHFEEVQGLTGEIYLKRKSISFAHMEEADFNKFYSKVMQLVLDQLPQYCAADINNMMNKLMKFM